jgi:mannose-6-phosphate isomerase-like protein (cupin superfamily)
MPSVGTLYSIASELGFSMDELFGDGGTAPRRGPDGVAPIRQSSPVQRRATRKAINLAGGVHWERLTPTPDDDVDFLSVTYEVGAASSPSDSLIHHGGKEYGIVTSGKLGVTIGFEDYELEPGDSIVFDSKTPHRLWTIGDEPASAVWVVIGRHGDSRSTLTQVV